MFHPNSQIGHQCFLSLCLKISNYAFEMCCIFIPFIIHFIFLYSGVVGSGLAVLSKFRILDTFFHKFLHNGYFWDVFHGDWFAGKGLGCAIVEHPLKRIHLFNTHVSLFVSFIFDVNCWYFFKRCLEVLLFRSNLVDYNTVIWKKAFVKGNVHVQEISLDMKGNVHVQEISLDLKGNATAI